MSTRRARVRRKVYSKLPRFLKNHDFEVFGGVLAILAGLPILFGRVKPASPEELLPTFVVIAWGFFLVFGGLFILLGVIKAAGAVFPDRVLWMRVEALGLTALAYSCYFYTVCILGVTPASTWVAAMLTLAFGGVCHVREVAIQIELEEYRSDLGLEEKA